MEEAELAGELLGREVVDRDRPVGEEREQPAHLPYAFGLIGTALSKNICIF